MSFQIDSINYFPRPEKFGTVGLGKLYLGIIDGDPANVPTDRIQAYIVRQGLPNLPINQPIDISAGGIPVYQGSPVQIEVLVGYSMQVIDFSGSQVYYTPNAGKIGVAIDSINAQILAIYDQLSLRIKTITTVATLRATKPDYANQVFNLLGYTQAGKGDGFVFYSGVVANTSSDNGVTIFVSSVGGVFYEFRRPYSPFINAYMGGALFDGATDDTAAIQRTINTNSSIVFPDGVCICDSVTIPASASGSVYIGTGFWNYGQTKKTIFKAKTMGVAQIFNLASGADNITFENMRIDGDSKAVIGINGTFGAFLALENVGVYGCTGYGLYSKQGLIRLRRCFFSNIGVGAHIYSDSTITDSEFTGGTIPLLLVAGGNRLVNVWANSGSVAQIRLTPFDASTTHINTSMANVYAGETQSSTSAPVIDILGIIGQAVQQVMITSSHLVHAAGGNFINGFVKITKAIDVTISGGTMRGQGSFGSASKNTAYAILSNECDTLSLTGVTIRDVNLNAIDLTNTQSFAMSGCTLRACGSTYAAGNQGANIIVRDGLTSGIATGNTFYVSNGSSVPYALDCPDIYAFSFEDNIINYPSAIIVNSAANVYAGRYQRYGAQVSQAINNATQNVSFSGSITTAAGASTTAVITLSTSLVNKSFKFFFQQSGSGANATEASIFAYNNLCGAITSGNTQSSPLANTITMSGNTVQFNQGSGYGATTWMWSAIRIS